MPVYNCAEYLHAAVESIERQTCGPERIRVIAVDDGSTDGARRILEEITEASPLAIDVLGYEGNHGANHARNVALSHGDAEFVYFMDADSMLRDDALEQLSAVLSSSEMPLDMGFAYSSFRRLWVPNEKMRTRDGRVGVEEVHPGPYDIRKLREANYISMMSLVRRSALPRDGFDEKIERFQDWDMWLTLFERGFAGVFLDEMLFSAYVRGGGISEDQSSYARLQRIVADKHSG
jgi:glycosyltransferase involved in cell wall biosynthesis